LFKKIGQPVVLGYIMAGFLVSSHVRFIPTVTDLPSIQIWAEIGVIFLLFALGLEFSFKKLLRVGGSATITALVEVMGMVLLGIMSGQIFGWSLLDSLFLGGILAISSTTIIIRTLSETGMKGRGFVDFVFGILIIEDLVAVLLLVLLSTVAVTNQFNGVELLYSAFKLVFFVILCFLTGIFILPTLFKMIRKNLSDEMLLIVALALCFLMVKLSTLAGFSPALGAFIMGSILAETSEVKKIEHLIRPMRDLFGAIFFVSVGMLIDPKTLIEYKGPIAILTLVTILGKFFTILVGALVSRKSLRHSVQAGLSLAQIGEFSFIIASLGLNLKVTSAFLYPMAVGISVITTFITPYLIANIDPIYLWIEKCLPLAAKKVVDTHRTPVPTSEKQKWKKNFSSSLILIVINSVIIYSLFYFFSWIFPKKDRMLGFWLTLIFSAPFFWAILMKKKEEFTSNRKERMSYVVLEIIRLVMVWALFRYLATQYLSPKLATSLALFFTMAFLFLFSPFLKKIYDVFEKHFMKNYWESDQSEYAQAHSHLASWDAHISNIVVPSESEVVGKTLHELKIRETFGISIALIERGELFIAAPGRDEKLFPNDRVAMIGSDDKLEAFINFLKIKKNTSLYRQINNYALHRVLVTETMSFAHQTIRRSGIREIAGGMVAGIERHGEKILNPDSNLEIHPGDILWIVADTEKLQNLQ
ncbi:MAG: cation:proton antiporter domain-containing protein, partial [Bacteriovorax sp.]